MVAVAQGDSKAIRRFSYTMRAKEYHEHEIGEDDERREGGSREVGATASQI